MQTRIIALCGNKQAGKDTTADLILDLLSHSHRIAFADPIVANVMHLYQLKDRAEYDAFKTMTHTLMGRKVSGRHLVREVGMIMRSYDEHQFVSQVDATINEKPHDLWVITDMRFDNEFEYIKRVGGRIIKIVNPDVEDNDDHVSEAGFPDSVCDAVVYNHRSTPEHFKESMTALMRGYLSDWYGI